MCGINHKGSIAQIVQDEGAQKHPYFPRGVKGFFENQNVIDRIIELREKKKKLFTEIADVLKEEGFLSFTGKEITHAQACYKYNRYNKLNNRKVE